MDKPGVVEPTRVPWGLAEAQDRSDLTQMMYRLGACLDEHRFDEMSALFTEDATAHTPGGIARGRATVVAQAARNHERYAGLQHLVSGVLIDLRGNDAEIRANVAVVFARDGGGVESGLGGVYQVRARLTPDGWRFARLEVHPVWRAET